MSDYKPKFRGVWVNPHGEDDGYAKVRATFGSETDASAWLYGMRSPNFAIEDMDGTRLVIRCHKERNGRLSHTYTIHTYTILASVDRAEREARLAEIEASGLAKGDYVTVSGRAKFSDPRGGWTENIETHGRILGLLEDPTEWPVCVYWIDSENDKRVRAWYNFDQVTRVEGEHGTT
jgi:hypothetical protein